MKHKAKQLLTSFEHKVTVSDSGPQRYPGKHAHNHPITSNLNWPLKKYVNLKLLFDFLSKKKKYLKPKMLITQQETGTHTIFKKMVTHFVQPCELQACSTATQQVFALCVGSTKGHSNNDVRRPQTSSEYTTKAAHSHRPFVNAHISPATKDRRRVCVCNMTYVL